MKYLFYILLLFSLSTCNFPELDFSEPEKTCTSETTRLQFTVHDYYSGQPISGTQLKVIEKVFFCAWCPLPDTILNKVGTLQGSLEGIFRHNPNYGVYYETLIVPPGNYLPVGPVPIATGCITSSKLRLKPKVKLGIWVKNLRSSPVTLNQISVAQKLDLPASQTYSYDPEHYAFSFTQAVNQTIPAKSDWNIFWFDALPEENLEVGLIYADNGRFTEQFKTGTDSIFYHLIRIR